MEYSIYELENGKLYMRASLRLFSNTGYEQVVQSASNYICTNKVKGFEFEKALLMEYKFENASELYVGDSTKVVDVSEKIRDKHKFKMYDVKLEGEIDAENPEAVLIALGKYEESMGIACRFKTKRIVAKNKGRYT